MNTKLLALFLLTSLSTLSFGQSSKITGPSVNLCPGVTYTYTADVGCDGKAGWTCAGCAAGVTDSGGKVKDAGTYSSGIVWAHIIWDNTSGGSVGNYCGTLDVSIASVAQPTISPGTQLLCGDGSITLQSTVSSTTNLASYTWFIKGTGVTPIGSVTTSVPQLTLNYIGWTPTSGLSATVAVGTKSTCGYATRVAPLSNELPGIPPIPRSAWVQLSPNPSGAGTPLSVLSSSTKYEMCPGESWTLTCTPPSGVSTNYGFDWYVNYFNGGSGVLINGAATSSTSLVHTSGNTASLTAPGGYGSFTVAARLNGNGCVSSQFMTLGTRRAGVYNSSEFSVVGPTMLCQNSTASYSPSLSGSDITSYKWSYSSSFKYQNGQGTPYLGLATNNPFSGGAVTLQLQNRCGYSGSPSVRNVGGRACAGVLVTASPNPASTTLQINITPPESKAASSLMTLNSSQPLQSAVSAVLVNESNVQLWSGMIDNDSHSIDISTFPNGTYYLKLTVDGEITTQRILIKH